MSLMSDALSNLSIDIGFNIGSTTRHRATMRHLELFYLELFCLHGIFENKILKKN